MSSKLHAELQIAWEYIPRFPHFKEVCLRGQQQRLLPSGDHHEGLGGLRGQQQRLTREEVPPPWQLSVAKIWLQRAERGADSLAGGAGGDGGVWHRRSSEFIFKCLISIIWSLCVVGRFCWVQQIPPTNGRLQDFLYVIVKGRSKPLRGWVLKTFLLEIDRQDDLYFRI